LGKTFKAELAGKVRRGVNEKDRIAYATRAATGLGRIISSLVPDPEWATDDAKQPAGGPHHVMSEGE
jgi:hypothetical protein